MVKPARDGSGFDAARDARPLAGESRAQFDAFLAIWAKIELEDLPGFFYWQRSAFDMLHDHLRDHPSDHPNNHPSDRPNDHPPIIARTVAIELPTVRAPAAGPKTRGKGQRSFTHPPLQHADKPMQN